MSDSSPPSSFEVEFEKLHTSGNRTPTPILDVVEPALVDTSASMAAAGSPSPQAREGGRAGPSKGSVAATATVAVTPGDGCELTADPPKEEEGKIATIHFDHPPTNAEIDREIEKLSLVGKEHVLVEVWTPMNTKERSRVSSRVIEKVKQLSVKQKANFAGHVVLLRPHPENMPAEDVERREVIRLIFEEPRTAEEVAENVKKLSEKAANRVIEVTPGPEDENQFREHVTRFVDEFDGGKLPFGAKAYVEMWAKPKGELQSPLMPARRIKYYHVPSVVEPMKPVGENAAVTPIHFYGLPPSPDMMLRVLKKLDLSADKPLQIRLHDIKFHEHLFGTLYFVAALAGADKTLWPIDDSTCIAWPYPEPNQALITVRFAKASAPMPSVDGADYSIFKLRVAKLKASPKDIARFVQDWEKQMTTVASKATRVSPIPPEAEEQGKEDEWKLVSHAKKKKGSKKRGNCSHDADEDWEDEEEDDEEDDAPSSKVSGDKKQKRLNIFIH